MTDYDTLCNAYLAQFAAQGLSLFGTQWYGYQDLNAAPITKTRTVGPWWNKRTETYEIAPTVTMSARTYIAYLALTKAQKDLNRLNGPADDTLAHQVAAALRRIHDVADIHRRTGATSHDIDKTVEVTQLLSMAAGICALVNLAEQRETIIAHVDPASLARTAAALTEDLDAARAYLSLDPIDRALTHATATSERADSDTPALTRPPASR